jgi:hypothetical protein
MVGASTRDSAGSLPYFACGLALIAYEVLNAVPGRASYADEKAVHQPCLR